MPRVFAAVAAVVRNALSQTRVWRMQAAQQVADADALGWHDDGCAPALRTRAAYQGCAPGGLCACNRDGEGAGARERVHVVPGV